jgi:hypothetical protein
MIVKKLIGGTENYMIYLGNFQQRSDVDRSPRVACDGRGLDMTVVSGGVLENDPDGDMGQKGNSQQVGLLSHGEVAAILVDPAASQIKELECEEETGPIPCGPNSFGPLQVLTDEEDGVTERRGVVSAVWNEMGQEEAT